MTVVGYLIASASFPVVLGDFGCDVTCQGLANNGKSKMAYLPGFMGKKRPPH